MGALREIVAFFGVKFDTKDLEKGHKEVESGISKLKEYGEAVLAAFAVEKVFEFGKELLESAEHLKVTAVALGTTTEELQGLDHAADQSGVQVDSLHSALARLQRGAADAATKGTSPAAVGFKKLGVSLKDEHGNLKTSGELFTDVADKIAGIKNPTERAGLANALFGRSYAQLLPLLLKGKDGIAELTGEVNELGFGMDDAFIENSEEVLHNTDRLKKGLRGLAIQAIGPLLPDLVKLTESGVELAKQFIPIIRNSEAFKTALGLLAGKGVLALVAKIAGGGGLTGVLKALGSVALRTILPFLALQDVLVFLTGGKSVTGDLLERFFGKGSADRVRQEISDIGDKVKAMWTDAVDAVKKYSGEIVALVATYGLITAAVNIFKGVQIAYRVVLAALAAAQRAYTVAVTATTAVMGLFEGETLAATAAALSASVAAGALVAPFLAAAAAVGALTLAYSQFTKLKAETGGLGITGIFHEMVKQGTLNPFAAVDHYQDEQARADAEKDPTATESVTPSRKEPDSSASFDPRATSATTPVPGGVHNSNVTLTNSPNVTVHVPPGTDRDMAQDVGDAAAYAVNQSSEDLRGTLSAVSPTAAPGG